MFEIYFVNNNLYKETAWDFASGQVACSVVKVI
jgi:hypothetical protein